MTTPKNILAIIGSASRQSANLQLVDTIAKQMQDDFNLIVFNELKSLPHFDPDLSITNPPQAIIDFRNAIEQADGVIICTPEYVFSIPSGLKNAIEWCISTTVFSDKPMGLITASASGQKGHEELLLIMKTAMGKFTEATTLRIMGIKGKINAQGELTDAQTTTDLTTFIKAFSDLVQQPQTI